jgi:hypothetical protein
LAIDTIVSNIDEPDASRMDVDVEDAEDPTDSDVLEEWTMEDLANELRTSFPVTAPEQSATPVSEDDEQFEVDFAHAGDITGKAEAPFSQHLSEQHTNEHNIYYPFSGAREWDLAVWLHESNLPLTNIDRFLRLEYVGVALRLPYSH